MSLATGESKKNDGKASGLPLSWGTRFVIAVVGTVLMWGMNFHWMRSSKGCTACTTWDVTWILIQACLIPLMGIFFLIWTLKLLWKQKFFLVQWLRLTNKQQGLFTAVFFAGTLLAVGIYYATLYFTIYRAINFYLGSYFSFLVVWISSFCWVSRRNAQIGYPPDSVTSDAQRGITANLRIWWNVRENRLNAISIFIILLAFVTPGRLANNLVWSVGLVIVCQLFLRLNQWVVALALCGHYDWALRLGRVFSWLPGFGRSFQGWIQLDAGRYSEAEASFRPLAFDESDQPRLASIELYFYATTLLDNDKYSEAQELFEAAIQIPQELRYFHYGLADCLLSQNKESDRARELIEQVMAKRHDQLAASQQRTLRTQCIAVHSWSLAACGHRAEAEARL